MTEVNLLFTQVSLPFFTNFKKFLQQEKPFLYLLHDAMHSFLKRLTTKFVKVTFVKECVKDNDFMVKKLTLKICEQMKLWLLASPTYRKYSLLENSEILEQDVNLLQICERVLY